MAKTDDIPKSIFREVITSRVARVNQAEDADFNSLSSCFSDGSGKLINRQVPVRRLVKIVGNNAPAKQRHCSAVQWILGDGQEDTRPPVFDYTLQHSLDAFRSTIGDENVLGVSWVAITTKDEAGDILSDKLQAL